MAYDGVSQDARNDLVAVSTTSVNIAPFRATPRTAIYIRNSSTGAQVITLSFGFTAVANTGIVLRPGESFTDANSESYICWQGTINGISSAADGQVSVYER